MRLLLAFLLGSTALGATSQPGTDGLEPLKAFAGAPWVGTLTMPDGTTATDISVWSVAVDGHAMRNVHALDDGSYAGETLVWVDGDAFGFVYVTTGGFTTSGTMTLTDDGSLEAIETVAGDGAAAGGVTRVRSRMRLESGLLIVRTTMERNGVWDSDTVRTYRRDGTASLPCHVDPACID